MTHTLETLLPLLDTPEGLERLRILTAEADGWTDVAFRKHPDSNKLCNDEPDYLWFGVNPEKTGIKKLADYTTSLDAIFAAEERLGLHNPNNGAVRQLWYGNARRLLDCSNIEKSEEFELAFLSPAQRSIAFILTAQSIKK